MSEKHTPESIADADDQAAVPEGKLRTGLILGSLAVFAAIIFGLFYLFVIAPAVPADGIGWSPGWFLFSFATGLTMIVLPCTLPLAFVIVPLSMGKGLLKGLSMAIAFGIGVAITLSLYGVAAAVVGSLAIDSLGAPLETVKNWVYFVAGIFALVFALSEIGLLKFRMPTYTGAAPAFIQKRQDALKALLLGLFLGNIGVGCPHPATPLLLIEVASSGDILYGWLMFLVHALGRILPLLLLAFMAILGVNGLNWLMTRKDAIERATGWAMVFVAGFILTLGLFSHDWWVNSGLHSGLETLTQESRITGILNQTLETNVEHVHGLEEGEGLFGLPLWLGNWFLVSLWLVPIWWWYFRRKKQLEHGEEVGEGGNLACEKKILGIKRSFLIVISIFLALTFIHFLPSNFYLKSISDVEHDDSAEHEHEPGTPDDHEHDSDGQSLDGVHVMPDGTIMNSAEEIIEGAHVMSDGTIMLADGTVVGEVVTNIPENATLFSADITGLPFATDPETVVLSDGDSYDITAFYVQKEVGNRTLRMMGYNGSVPGPFIKADEGAEITINFTNNTDLDQTIHSHGVRIDNNSDGVPGVTQGAVPPGGSYTYTVKFKDAGVYWYHPHTRDDYGQEMGLYGNYLIDPETGYSSSVNREIPLVIDDILIENEKIVDFYREITNFALLGRFGDQYLVNGEKNYALTAKAGEVVRFFVTNVSNARTYNLSIPGAEMKLIGADVGQYEREEFAENFLISPAERMIIEAYFERSGTYLLTHTMPSGKVGLTKIVVSDDVASPSYADQFKILNTKEDVVEEFADFRSFVNTQPDKKVLLTVAITGQVDHSAHTGHTHDDGSGAPPPPPKTRMESIQWDDPNQTDKVNTTENIIWKMIDENTGRESMDIPVSDWTFTQGDLVKIRLTNDADADHVMQHPIHLHGQRFVVLSENGVLNDNMAWKDTVLVFPSETVDILVEMSNLGEWMSHCHISEHLHAGMMLQFRVEDENGYATGDEFRTALPQPALDRPSSPVQVSTLTGDTYTFTTELPESNFSAIPENKFYQAGKVDEVVFTIIDRSGAAVQLSDSDQRPFQVTFVKSDNSVLFTTFPGNTSFPAALDSHGEAGHDNSDGHHDEPEPEPVHDNSDGHHGFLSIPYAYANGGDDHSGDSVPPSGTGSVYTVPVLFPEKGNYRAFVEFIPLGSSEVRVASFNIEVAPPGLSINNFGWSVAQKWWILLIISIALMTPLSYGVFRYINTDRGAKVKEGV